MIAPDKMYEIEIMSIYVYELAINAFVLLLLMPFSIKVFYVLL